MMEATDWYSSQPTPTSGYKNAVHVIPLRQCHRSGLASSEDGDPEPSTSLPTLAVTTPRRRDSNSLWMYYEELINLYWVQNLPLREVREIMKQEHGLDASVKVYKSQFRRWGIRKNIKRKEALELATGQKSSSVFWPGGKDEDYASRIDRHVKKNNRLLESASSHTQTCMAIGTRTLPRRIRAPDTLEKVEAASYYLHVYIRGNHETEKWFTTGNGFEEQEAFNTVFIKSLERLSRNDRPQQAFQDINRAFDQLKQIVIQDHPIVYLKLMIAATAFAQYPKSEICLKICRLLSDHVRKLTLLIHGPHHPLNHVWSDTLHISSGTTPGSLVLGVVVTGVQKCMARRASHATGALDIADYVPSHARDLDEASLRGNLVKMAARPELLPRVQETRLALSELLINTGRVLESAYFLYEVLAFMEDDPERYASKLFWLAELKWRNGSALGCLDDLRSAMAYIDTESVSNGDNDNTRELRHKIEEAFLYKHELLVSMEMAGTSGAGHKCPVINF